MKKNKGLLSRSFSLPEKIVLSIILIAVLGFLYYEFVDQNVKNQMINLEAEEEGLQMQVDAVNTKLQKFKAMEEELKNEGTYMLSYNGSSDEIKLLNDIFGSATEYNIEFTDLTRYGSQIRRSFYFEYTVSNYNQAKTILSKLVNSKYRLILTDVKMEKDEEDGTITATGNATFYETMQDAKEDQALPIDEKAAEEAAAAAETESE